MKLIENSYVLESSEDDIVDVILESRGVDPKKHKNILEVFEPKLSNFLYYNIEELSKQLISLLSLEGIRIAIVVDEDADGYTSATYMYKILEFLKKYCREDSDMVVDFIVHDTKIHGINEQVIDDVYEGKYDTVIIPDAGSNDFEKAMELSILQNVENIFIIDHHDMNEELHTIPKVLLVNNQDSRNIPNEDSLGLSKNISGVGMVYALSRVIASYLPPELSKSFIEDLSAFDEFVAIGNIGDSMNQQDEMVRYLTMKFFNNKGNEFTNAFHRHWEIKQDKLAPIDLSFNIISHINALTRVGTKEERQLLIELMATDEKIIETVTRKKRDPISRKYFEYSTQVYKHDEFFNDLKKIKGKQDRLVKKIVSDVELEMDNSNNIIIAEVDEKKLKYRGITGLIANKISSKYGKPMLLGVMKDSVLVGSGRGVGDFNFKEFLLNSNVNWAFGHDNAFGFSMNEEDIERILQKSNTESLSKDIKVDKIIREFENVDFKTLINWLDENREYFGSGVKQPLFGVEKQLIKRNTIQAKTTMVNFKIGNLYFTMYGVNEELMQEFKYGHNDILVSCYGELEISRFTGIDIHHFNITNLSIDKDNDSGIIKLGFPTGETETDYSDF